MTVRVIDCETTGTDAAVDEVIEIASVDMVADGGITNHQEVLICPTIPVPPEASAVHHLLYQDLTGRRAPMPSGDSQRLLSRLRGLSRRLIATPSPGWRRSRPRGGRHDHRGLRALRGSRGCAQGSAPLQRVA